MTKIILKCDDFYGIDKNFKQSFFHKLVLLFRIKVNWGIIGYEFNKFTNKTIISMKKALNSGFYAFFNHGYFHNMDEFKLLCETDQIYHILETNRIVYERLGLKLDCFGAPCNSLNSESLTALNKCSDIKYWLFGNEDYKHVCIKRILDIEYPLFKPNFIKFYKKFHSITPEDVLCLQIHPNAWNILGFVNFICIIIYLKVIKADFIFVHEIMHQQKRKK